MRDATRHDSLTAQLRELDSLQEARVREEEETRLRAAEEARRRDEEAARLRREQEEKARLREEEEQARQADARRNEEERQLRLRQEAALRLELEAKRQAQAEARQRELEHECEIAAIRLLQSRKVRNSRLAVGGLIAMLLAGSVGYVFGVQPAMERKALEAERARQAHELALDERNRAQQSLLDEQQRAAEAREATADLERRIEQRQQWRRDQAQRRNAKPRTPSRRKKADCAPDDPLCGLKID